MGTIYKLSNNMRSFIGWTIVAIIIGGAFSFYTYILIPDVDAQTISNEIDQKHVALLVKKTERRQHEATLNLIRETAQKMEFYTELKYKSMISELDVKHAQENLELVCAISRLEVQIAELQRFIQTNKFNEIPKTNTVQ